LSDAAARLAAALADRYRVERELGQGGMATVYLAHDLRHERQVAVKVLRPELAAVIGAERFVQEIRTTAALQHPNILPLFDSGEAAGFLYYVMPFLPGPSLRDRLAREGQLGVAEAIAITRQVAGALASAHAHGIVHRDVKPDNIMFSAGQAVVADFGIARALDAAAGQQLTLTGMAIGTPAYMSPEQSVGEPGVDARSDLYSLATVLYEMLAGEPPVTGASAQSMIAKVMTEAPTHVRVVRI
jgi:serine/threonine-protein kinase